jgi:hypothetical protein
MTRLRPMSLLARAAEMLDRRIGWHRLPVPLGLVTLIGLRRRLRERNLRDAPPATRSVLPTSDDERYVFTRTADGTRNDLENPTMGSAGMPFGRNVPLESAYPENPRDVLEGPNPREVSRELLTRDAFKPARTLNLLAAAWLQFEIRDWFSHGKGTMEDPWDLRLEEADPWPHGTMRVPRTPEAPRPPDETSPPAFPNQETHWWDASQIYGNTRAQQEMIRSGEDGKLRLGPDESIPSDILDRLSEEPGWWIGLALMFTLFAREHNSICDQLREDHPHWSDDELFEHARLVNAALMAKIHTVEWTTAILGHPTLQIAMRANWWGLATERIHKLFGRISESEVVSGIPGSKQDHFGVPYSLTEEFAAVYRMHPLIPDYFSFRSAATDEALRERPLSLREVQDKHVRGLLEQTPMIDLLYSFGVSHPGEITLHNFPRFLQEFRRPSARDKETDGEVFMDLAATDILRTRELGVPRYNEFRRLLGLRPVESFEGLTDNPKWVEEIRRVYNDDIDRVDLMVGLFAEPKPEGFGFSDTAFRIFVLMASRRLNSDRFFTTDYNARTYTRAGLHWIDNNTMSTVLIRHYPDLRPLLRGVKNAFAPWPRADSRGGRR